MYLQIYEKELIVHVVTGTREKPLNDIHFTVPATWFIKMGFWLLWKKITGKV